MRVCGRSDEEGLKGVKFCSSQRCKFLSSMSRKPLLSHP